MTHQWKVGDLAVCVDAAVRGDSYGRNVSAAFDFLKHRAVYRVAAARVFSGELVVRLVGDPLMDNDIGGYRAWRFRPLVSDTDDTALIARIRACKPARQEVG